MGGGKSLEELKKRLAELAVLYKALSPSQQAKAALKTPPPPPVFIYTVTDSTPIRGSANIYAAERKVEIFQVPANQSRPTIMRSIRGATLNADGPQLLGDSTGNSLPPNTQPTTAGLSTLQALIDRIKKLYDEADENNRPSAMVHKLIWADTPNPPQQEDDKKEERIPYNILVEDYDLRQNSDGVWVARRRAKKVLAPEGEKGGNLIFQNIYNRDNKGERPTVLGSGGSNNKISAQALRRNSADLVALKKQFADAALEQWQDIARLQWEVEEKKTTDDKKVVPLVTSPAPTITGCTYDVDVFAPVTPNADFATQVATLVKWLKDNKNYGVRITLPGMNPRELREAPVVDDWDDVVPSSATGLTYRGRTQRAINIYRNAIIAEAARQRVSLEPNRVKVEFGDFRSNLIPTTAFILP